VLRAALQQDVAAVRVTGRTGAAENFGPATGSGRRATRAANNLSLAARTTEVIGDGSKVVGMDYEDRTTGEIKHLAVAGIFVQIGLVPNTEFLKGSEIALTRFGEIEIDTKGATSLPGVYAAGDATTVPFKQIIISMGAGATAALGAFDYLIRNPAPEAQATQADATA
jgi:alkyl hydroperoxide reductase subunit F